jgi:hypothetical protein
MTGRAMSRAMGHSDAPDVLERDQFLAAAERARRVYPGTLGELLHRELSAFAEFGYRLATDDVIPRLAVEVLRERSSASVTAGVDP